MKNLKQIDLDQNFSDIKYEIEEAQIEEAHKLWIEFHYDELSDLAKFVIYDYDFSKFLACETIEEIEKFASENCYEPQIFGDTIELLAENLYDFLSDIGENCDAIDNEFHKLSADQFCELHASLSRVDTFTTIKNEEIFYVTL